MHLCLGLLCWILENPIKMLQLNHSTDMIRREIKIMNFEIKIIHI